MLIVISRYARDRRSLFLRAVRLMRPLLRMNLRSDGQDLMGEDLWNLTMGGEDHYLPDHHSWRCAIELVQVAYRSMMGGGSSPAPARPSLRILTALFILP